MSVVTSAVPRWSQRRVPNVNAQRPQPLLDLLGVEPEEAPDLQEREPPLEHQPPNVPDGDVEPIRHRLDVQQRVLHTLPTEGSQPQSATRFRAESTSAVVGRGSRQETATLTTTWRRSSDEVLTAITRISPAMCMDFVARRPSFCSLGCARRSVVRARGSRCRPSAQMPPVPRLAT